MSIQRVLLHCLMKTSFTLMCSVSVEVIDEDIYIRNYISDIFNIESYVINVSIRLYNQLYSTQLVLCSPSDPPYYTVQLHVHVCGTRSTPIYMYTCMYYTYTCVHSHKYEHVHYIHTVIHVPHIHGMMYMYYTKSIVQFESR